MRSLTRSEGALGPGRPGHEHLPSCAWFSDRVWYRGGHAGRSSSVRPKIES